MFCNFEHDGGNVWRGGFNASWFRWHEACQYGKHIVNAWVEGFTEGDIFMQAVVDDFGNLVGADQ